MDEREYLAEEISELREKLKKYKEMVYQLKDLYDAEMPITKTKTPYGMIVYLEHKYFPKE